MDQRFIDFLLRQRYWMALLSLALTYLIASGARDLYLEQDYKMFFKDDDIHLLAHEEMQDMYTSTDNVAIMFKTAEGDMYSPENLAIIEDVTERVWQTPYVIRVDSLSNFQNTAADGEDLSVADLVEDPLGLTPDKIAGIRKTAENEKALFNRIISKDGKTTVVSVTLELPPEPDPQADKVTQAEQRKKRDLSYPEVVDYGRDLIAELEVEYPHLEIHLGGMVVVTHAFTESSVKDMSTMIPLMYLMIVVTLAIFLRSIGSIVGSVLVIGMSTLVGVGAAGWFGYALNTVNVTAPIIILAIAVCDSVHLLSIYLRGLGQQLTPFEAMRDSFRLNLQPIVLTSVTTAVGFLTLNFSISPPFAELGNMTAAGVIWAMVLTFTLLPAITMLLVRKRKPQPERELMLNRFSEFVVANKNKVFVGAVLSAILFSSFIPLNTVNDDPINYFEPGVPFRDASDFMIDNVPGVQDINFSISCGEPGCINDVEYLTALDEFDGWMSAYPGVEFVSSYASVIKRLNRSMNRDEEEYFRVPDDRSLSAQYNLMYEMSLPYGLDLNNQINMDKSATLVMTLIKQTTSSEFIAVEAAARNWLSENHPQLESPGASVSVMFAQMGVKNIYAMLLGGVIAVIGVTLTLLIALRSFRYALISMIPNGVPALMAFGVWGVLVGEINLAVAAVFSITLGILVDDTVHFISKYRRGREVKGLSPEDSIHYAFANVGGALVVTTAVLVIGFSMLTLSDFNLNAMAGKLTAITIAIALIFDFFILPPLLLMFDPTSKQTKHQQQNETQERSSADA